METLNKLTDESVKNITSESFNLRYKELHEVVLQLVAAHDDGNLYAQLCETARRFTLQKSKQIIPESHCSHNVITDSHGAKYKDN